MHHSIHSLVKVVILLLQIFKNKLHNYFAFDTMCQGELPDYFKQYALNRNITISLNKADEEVIKSASTKLDYLAFSYLSQ